MRPSNFEKHVHFGSLRTLCFEKHSELPAENKVYKGRVVFRVDQLKDETGHFAVFTEQGTSASQLAAAKYIDAIARMPGCAGGDSDAVGAYTQVALDEVADLGLDPKSIVDTWISLPYDQRPASWANI